MRCCRGLMTIILFWFRYWDEELGKTGFRVCEQASLNGAKKTC